MLPMTVRFTTYNLLDLFAADTAEARQHYETIAGVIRALDADVLAVQEILAPDAATAARAAPHARGRCGHAVRGARRGWSLWFLRFLVPKPRSRSAATATTWG